LVSQAPERIHQSLKDTIAFLDKELATLQKDIKRHIDRHPDLKDDSRLLQSIPAVGPQVGNHLLCLLRASSFHTAEQLPYQQNFTVGA
jgi:hypothetical protein